MWGEFFPTFFWNLGKEHLCWRKKQQLSVWYPYSGAVQDCNKVGVGLFSQVTRNRTRGNAPRLHQGTFKLDIMKSSFTERVVRPWNKRLSEVVEVFKICVGVTLGTRCSGDLGSAELRAGFILKVCSNLSISIIPWGHSVSSTCGSCSELTLPYTHPALEAIQYSPSLEKM